MGLPTLQDGGLRRHLEAAYRHACLNELNALKPGNVHRFADGHGMTLADFITSAEVSAAPLTTPGLGLGERIFRAVEATHEAVGCNTNLGILLLCAPLVQCLLDEHQPPGKLRDGIRHLLMSADVNDTVWLFRAIQLAAPGGLGQSEKHDVFQPSTTPLFEVMAHAAERDLIARQYATGFADLFDFALPRLYEFEQRWQNRAWATTGLYLGLLARFPDTHIQRKYGLGRATAVSRQAADLAREFSQVEKPEHYQLRLLHADTEFKREGINPGTSADMTVATLFISNLEPMLPAFEQKTGFSRVRDSRSDGVGIRS
jgi:triphosphoribosyl-dephospho-CoA synthase